METGEWLDKFIEKSLSSLRDMENCYHDLDKQIEKLKTQMYVLYAILLPLIVYVAKEFLKPFFSD